MTTIDLVRLVRPKDVDLEEMFDLRLKIALASDGHDITERMPITLGQTKVNFTIEAAAIVNQAILYKNNDELFSALRTSPVAMVGRGWTATLTINWIDIL